MGSNRLRNLLLRQFLTAHSEILNTVIGVYSAMPGEKDDQSVIPVNGKRSDYSNYIRRRSRGPGQHSPIAKLALLPDRGEKEGVEVSAIKWKVIAQDCVVGVNDDDAMHQ
jgi:hypothetical protein